MEKLIKLLCAIADEHARRGNEAASIKVINTIYEAWDLDIRTHSEEVVENKFLKVS